MAVPLVIAGISGGYLLWRAQPRAVTVVHARIGPAIELVYATGFVEPEQPVAVASRVTAPVLEVFADEGTSVRKGQALLRLDAADQRGELDQAVARSHEATLAEQRTIVLFGDGWVTRAARDGAVATAQTARAAERTARARVDQHVVRAGIDGIVIKRDVEPGDLALPTRTLMLLGDPHRTRVTATVDERDVPRVHPGQSALLSSDAWPGQVLKGHVRTITPTGDPTQRAFRVRLALVDRKPLPLGMTLEVNIVSRRVDEALLIPRSALSDSTIWVVEDGRARKRTVRPGIMGNNDVQIIAGLRRGEIVITTPAGLRDDERVRIQSR